jgi:cytoskeleton-associated protein 5
MSNGSGPGSGHATPAEGGAGRERESSDGLGRSQNEGVESWRRAAEVTQNLKARIEMMKVSFEVCPWMVTT